MQQLELGERKKKGIKETEGAAEETHRKIKEEWSKNKCIREMIIRIKE